MSRKSELDYGHVVFVAGPEKGNIGIYDDDDGHWAIVYMAPSYNGRHVLAPKRHLMNVNLNGAVQSSEDDCPPGCEDCRDEWNDTTGLH